MCKVNWPEEHRCRKIELFIDKDFNQNDRSEQENH